MSANFVEELVSEFYRIQGYFVQTNYWIPIITTRTRIQNGKTQTYKAQSWTDIDVLAINDKEIHIIQVKAIVNEKKVANKIIDYFGKIEDYLSDGVAPDGVNSIQWWTEGRKIKRFVIHEYYSPPSYLQLLRDNHIEVVDFQEIFNHLNTFVDKKRGLKVFVFNK
ncbi:hypothetical protein [Tenuibacillus multivorans]|uniref:PD-(D/E)XK nuclease superfamily protein n=1 Tax=Tenuibacillus multivorans TaxID=237069 RepID=A0A1H0E3G9_9BACI|nr:hypothetical protein [Tenuibacillus multivorans]GEL76664.1 hypothetical protein TMU01_08990 [Tenuibacillus multivorans]SDN77027.1 hypothetical protein SAMN05216498_3053 [Tenuibacillus multivorans]